MTAVPIFPLPGRCQYRRRHADVPSGSRARHSPALSEYALRLTAGSFSAHCRVRLLGESHRWHGQNKSVTDRQRNPNRRITRPPNRVLWPGDAEDGGIGGLPAKINQERQLAAWPRSWSPLRICPVGVLFAHSGEFFVDRARDELVVGADSASLQPHPA